MVTIINNIQNLGPAPRIFILCQILYYLRYKLHKLIDFTYNFFWHDTILHESNTKYI